MGVVLKLNGRHIHVRMPEKRRERSGPSPASLDDQSRLRKVTQSL